MGWCQVSLFLIVCFVQFHQNEAQPCPYYPPGPPPWLCNRCIYGPRRCYRPPRCNPTVTITILSSSDTQAKGHTNSGGNSDKPESGDDVSSDRTISVSRYTASASATATNNKAEAQANASTDPSGNKKDAKNRVALDEESPRNEEDAEDGIAPDKESPGDKENVKDGDAPDKESPGEEEATVRSLRYVA